MNEEQRTSNSVGTLQNAEPELSLAELQAYVGSVPPRTMRSGLLLAAGTLVLLVSASWLLFFQQNSTPLNGERNSATAMRSEIAFELLHAGPSYLADSSEMVTEPPGLRAGLDLQ